MENYEADFPSQDPKFNDQNSAPFDAAPFQAASFADPLDDMQQTPYYEYSFAEPVIPELPKKKSRKIWKTILASVLVVALTAAGCGITAFSVDRYWAGRYGYAENLIGNLQDKLDDLQQQVNDNSYTGSGNSISGTPNTSTDGMTPGQVYAKCASSVVAISTTVGNRGTSLGTGFIVSEDGYILSNHHVIEGATSVSVTTHSGETYSAKIMGSDSNNDLALLKVEATGLKYVSLGSSDDLIVGDQVVAIGNALGELSFSLTVGYISGIDRDVNTDGSMMSMLQTDAAINSGNSGGPLFNMKGEVVGITTAKYSGKSSSGASIEGIGFAIPIDDVMKVVADLKEFGYVKSAYMGIMVRDLNAEMAEIYGLPVGAYVDSVEAGGPAAKAGMQAKDIITGLGDFTIRNMSDLTRALRTFEPGDTTTVYIYRAGAQLQLQITLMERPREADTTTPTEPESGMPNEGSYEEWFDYFFPFG